MLHQHIKTPKVTLLLASNLPPNNYHKNCFRSSFHYQYAKNVLFVRGERLESIGDFIMVILHCVSHIKANDLADDGNPVFLREFYKVIIEFCFDFVSLFILKVGPNRVLQGNF